MLSGLLRNQFVWIISPELSMAWERCEVTASWFNIQQWELTHCDAWLWMLMLQKKLKPWDITVYQAKNCHGSRTIHKSKSAWGTARETVDTLGRESARQLGICDCRMWSDQSRHYCWTHSFTYFIISWRSTVETLCLPKASIAGIGIAAQHDKFYKADKFYKTSVLPLYTQICLFMRNFLKLFKF